MKNVKKILKLKKGDNQAGYFALGNCSYSIGNSMPLFEMSIILENQLEIF